jgi:cell division protein FtsB
MREFQERRVWRKIIFSKFTFAVLAAVLIFSTYSTAKIYLRSRQAKEANGIIAKQLEDLKVKKSELEASVKRLQTEAGAEEEIRGKFPVQKPGEKAVIIVERENSSNNPAEESAQGFFQNLPRFFRGIWQFVKNIF